MGRHKKLELEEEEEEELDDDLDLDQQEEYLDAEELRIAKQKRLLLEKKKQKLSTLGKDSEIAFLKERIKNIEEAVEDLQGYVKTLWQKSK